jgi:oligo-1,6-glucosidase
MQWDDSLNAGFSVGAPWLKVNPNYIDINVAAARANPNSIWYWYRDLIALRKQEKTLVYGAYTPFMVESEQVFAFRRSAEAGDFLVLVNLSDVAADIELPTEVHDIGWSALLNNLDADADLALLQPWQALVLKA